MALTVETPRVLVVAGSDSSGGAGLVRDIETLSAFGLRASLAVTALTAQTDGAVMQIETTPAKLVASQMRAALSSGHVRAVKLGMLASPEIVLAVEEVLNDHPALPVVVDPVLASSSGMPLMEGEGLPAYRPLFPRVTLFTPNLPELAALTGLPEALSDDEAIRQARILMAQGLRSVLVKGGHAQGVDAADLLVSHKAVVRHAGLRLAVSLRGTGCALASAIAAELALGTPLDQSVQRAKAYVFRRLQAAKAADGA